MGVLLVIGIIVALVFVGVVAMEKIADASHGEMHAVVQILGNNVVVTQFSDTEPVVIAEVLAYIDGVAETRGKYVVKNPSVGKPVTFEELADGVTGSAFVIVEATFSDGTHEIVDYTRLQFA